jgi:hypothetical protein
VVPLYAGKVQQQTCRTARAAMLLQQLWMMLLA